MQIESKLNLADVRGVLQKGFDAWEPYLQAQCPHGVHDREAILFSLNAVKDLIGTNHLVEATVLISWLSLQADDTVSQLLQALQQKVLQLAGLNLGAIGRTADSVAAGSLPSYLITLNPGTDYQRILELAVHRYEDIQAGNLSFLLSLKIEAVCACLRQDPDHPLRRSMNQRWRKNLVLLKDLDTWFYNDFVHGAPPPGPGPVFSDIDLLGVENRLLVKTANLWHPHRPPGRSIVKPSMDFDIYVCTRLSDFWELIHAQYDMTNWGLLRSPKIVALPESLFCKLASQIDLMVFYDHGPHDWHLLRLEHLRQDLRRMAFNRCQKLPERIVCRDPALRGEVTAFINQSAAEMKELTQKYHNATHIRYGAEPIKYLGDRIAKGAKLKILFQTSRFTTYQQYACQDLATGFRKMGHIAIVRKEQRRCGAGNSLYHTAKFISRFAPDIVIGLNQTRYTYHTSLPTFVTWIQDQLPPIFPLPADCRMGANDVIFSSSKVLASRFARQPQASSKTVHILPFLLNPDRFHPLETQYQYDVSLVSHIHMVPEFLSYFDPKRKTHTPEERLHHVLIGWLEEMTLFDIQRFLYHDQDYGAFIRQAAREIGGQFTGGEDLIFTILVNQIIAPLTKIRCVRALINAGFKISLFGAGWDLLPLTQAYARGVIKDEKALNTLYNQTRINLCCTCEQSFLAHTVEIMGSGGFCLTLAKGEFDHLPLTAYFEEGTQVVLFDDEADLIRKTTCYLENPEKRQEIARAGHEAMRAGHTVMHGARTILETLARESQRLES